MGVNLSGIIRPFYFISLFIISMYTLIITSKDRPAQLEALLSSIEKNAPFFNTRIIYKASNEEFQKGYDVLRSYGHRAIFLKEKNFREDLSDSLHGRFITFATDDGIFFRDLSKEYWEFPFILDKQTACVSLRLGANTPMNNYYSPNYGQCYIQQVKHSDGYFNWNHREAAGNFAYPLSVDAHVFRSEVIIPLIDKTNFNNPNSLEANLQRWSSELPPFMAAPFKSAYVGNSINRVQDEFQNYAGGTHGISAEELNKKFLDGYRIDWEKFPFDEVKSPHHEFKVYWK